MPLQSRSVPTEGKDSTIERTERNPQDDPSSTVIPSTVGNVEPLPLRRIVRFWGPLAATWIMMSIEGPILTAVIARLADPEFHLASYGVAFNIAMFVEAPIIMMLSAATALVRDYDSFRRLRNFTYALNGTITLGMIILSIPAIFFPFAEKVLDLEPHIARLTHTGAILLILWPAAIGFRRFWQGILIRDNLPRLVAWGTVVRLCSMGTGALVLWGIFDAPGIIVGAGALAIGVIGEAVAARFMVAGSLRRLREKEASEKPPPTYGEIARFYWPLALTSMIGLAAQPFVTGFLGHSRNSIESLAVWPVVGGFVFLFRGVGLAWQEAVIALIGENREQYAAIRRFTVILALSTSGLLTLVAFTPLASFWYEEVAGLSPELASFALTATQIMAMLPATSAYISFQRSLLVVTGHTAPISVATAIEVSVIIAVMLVAIGPLNAVGVIAAAASVVIGRLCSNTYLEWQRHGTKRILRKKRK